MLTKIIETKLRHHAGVRLVKTMAMPDEIKDLIGLLLKNQTASLSHPGPGRYLGRYSALVDYRLETIIDGSNIPRRCIEWTVAYANADKPIEEAYANASSMDMSLHYNKGGNGRLPDV